MTARGRKYCCYIHNLKTFDKLIIPYNDYITRIEYFARKKRRISTPLIHVAQLIPLRLDNLSIPPVSNYNKFLFLLI